MKNQFFDQKIFNNLELPMQKLIELNFKMMQNFSYLKPVDLLSVRKPEEALEKHMEMFIQNSHMAFNYMRDAFYILENHWLNVSRNLDQSTRKMISESSATPKKSTKKVSSAAKSTAKKATSSIKKATSSVKGPALKKSIKVTRPAAQNKVTSVVNTTRQPAHSAASSKPKSSGIQQTKEPMSATTPKVGSMPEKSGIRDLGIHNLNKNNPLSR